MSFIEKLKRMKAKLTIIISVGILFLAFAGVGITRYANAVNIKEGLNLGNKYLQEGKYEEAILALQKVIQIDLKNVEARVGLAKAYVNTGRPDEAAKILKEAININRKKVEPYLELTKLYISGNNPVYAIKILTDGYNDTNDESIKFMLEDLKSKIAVDKINIIITLGESYSLPNEVTVKINDVPVQMTVEWDITTVDTAKLGSQTFTGTLENTDKTVELTLNVVGIASIENINSKVNQNDKYSLPSKVTAKMTDGSTREVEVTWNPSSVNTSKTGTYSYQGTVNGYDEKVKLTLNVESLAKVIVFSDKNLQQAIRKEINKPTGDIYKSDIEKITELNLLNKDIKDISGIENLSNLSKLTLRNNDIKDVSPLRTLANLKYLDMGNYGHGYLNSNDIRDLTPLKSLRKLETLDACCLFQLENLEPLSSLKNLKELNLQGDLKLRKISPISSLTSLQKLDLGYDVIEDITPLKSLTNLKELNLERAVINSNKLKELRNSLPSCKIHEP